MVSLIEDCQAWFNKGQESWKFFFSKWETFAEYEESLPEGELIHELGDKCKKRRNGNQKLLKLPLAKKGLKRVFFKNQQRKQKRLIRKKKSCQKGEEETSSHGNENIVEILENKQLEISFMTVFSDLFKANTNKYELFAVLFQTFTDKEMTMRDSDHLLSRHVIPYNDFERRVTNLSLENPRLLSRSKLRNSFSGRSICPPRHVYLQSLNENLQENNSRQMQSNLRQCQNPRIGGKDADNVSRNNFSKQQSLTLDGRETLNLEKRCNWPYYSDLFRIKNAKSVDFDHKFSESYQNKECLRSTTLSEFNVTQEGGRLGNLSLQHRINRISLSMDNANFITALKKISEHKHVSKMPSQKRYSSEVLISACDESDSDGEDQAKHCSPLIHCQNKRLKDEGQVVDALVPDADDFQHIFDRVMKS